MAVEGRTHKPVVDFERCSTCGVCMDACPAEHMPEMRREDSMRARIYDSLDTNVHLKETEDPHPPKCQGACPISQDIRGYIRLIARKKYREALELIRATNPLPSICGHICHHPCESACVRNRLDEALSIRSLKRFAAKAAGDMITPEESTPDKSHRVAIIGSGPAGLTAGYDLARKGYAVDIIESHDRAGGLPAWAIPDFRLPRELLNKDIDFIRGTGVNIRTGITFGRDLTLSDLKNQGFSAVILATGTQKGLKLNFKDEGRIQGYWECLDFLRRASDGDQMDIGNRVIVVGGGNAAMDSARCAVRQGASEVIVIYRRGQAEMSADPEEVQAALEDGVHIRYNTMPLQFTTQSNRLTGLDCARTEPVAADDRNRPVPVRIQGSDFHMAADTVISALGQKPDLESLSRAWGQGVQFLPDGRDLTTNLDGVFTAGDFAHGSSTVVEAMAGGRKAAEKVDAYLSRLG